MLETTATPPLVLSSYSSLGAVGFAGGVVVAVFGVAVVGVLLPKGYVWEGSLGSGNRGRRCWAFGTGS